MKRRYSRHIDDVNMDPALLNKLSGKQFSIKSGQLFQSLGAEYDSER